MMKDKTSLLTDKARKDNCFDFLRYLFAYSILIYHFYDLTDTDRLWPINSAIGVRGFFVIGGFLVTHSFLRPPLCTAFEPVALSSLVIGIAYYCKPLNIFSRIDNVTYGIYLYHYPIIQTLILYGVADYSITLCFILSIVITTVVASLSWVFVEKG